MTYADEIISKLIDIDKKPKNERYNIILGILQKYELSKYFGLKEDSVNAKIYKSKHVSVWNITGAYSTCGFAYCLFCYSHRGDERYRCKDTFVDMKIVSGDDYENRFDEIVYHDRSKKYQVVFSMLVSPEYQDNKTSNKLHDQQNSTINTLADKYWNAKSEMRLVSDVKLMQLSKKQIDLILKTIDMKAASFDDIKWLYDTVKIPFVRIFNMKGNCFSLTQAQLKELVMDDNFIDNRFRPFNGPYGAYNASLVIRQYAEMIDIDIAVRLRDMSDRYKQWYITEDYLMKLFMKNASRIKDDKTRLYVECCLQ